MPYECASFNEVCRRAGGRRAYNKMRRIERARRISAILRLQDAHGDMAGRDLARLFGVHEATISRDLKFIRGIKASFRRQCLGLEMQAANFFWGRDALGWGWEFKFSDGARVK